ncbi:MAG: BLUF domain-containing protein [Pseudomonadales bacterium]|nr:BLUF domain-containing protein [Pseudomonadales bacterium]
MSLLALAYVSDARPGLVLRDLKHLLRRSREFNFRHGVTGLLLYDGAHFVQWLEGPDDAVDPLMDAIRVDARHSGVRICMRRAQDARVFGDWVMGCARLAGAEAATLRGSVADFVAAEDPTPAEVKAFFVLMQAYASPGSAPALAL